MFEPQYTITNRILTSIAQIEAAEEVIQHAPILPLWEKQFREDAVVRAVHHGTHLEGNLLAKDEAKDVLMGRDIVARARDIQEVINYRKVLDLIDEETDKKIEKITEQLIQKVHRIIVHNILPQDQSGIYRKKQVVLRNSQTGEVSYRPPSPVEVPFLMKEFVYWLNKLSEDDLHPVLKAGIVHHELVRIHPFVDGNGRLARALSTLLLLLGGYDIRRFFSLEEYYDRNAASYFESLQQASSGNLTAWLEYFTYGAAYEFNKVKTKILKLSQDAKLKERMGGKQLYLTDRQIRILEYIQDIGYIQNKMFSSVFPDFSEDTVLRDIQDLTQKGIIKKVGSTKGARYVSVS